MKPKPSKRGWTRRAILGALGAAVGGAAMGLPRAQAHERIPYGGRIVLHVPWPLGKVDPHRIDDAAAACFGEALFDTLYVREPGGGYRPSLAESDPEIDGLKVRVKVRRGVRFASGLSFDARAAAASIERARSLDAAAWLADVPAARVEDGSLVFTMRDARPLARALASPLVAMVPVHFSPEQPDGTGPFQASVRGSGRFLARNVFGASGPAYLESIELRAAADLGTSLRAFESGADDVGWLGSFLHEPRAGARSFDAGRVGWAILRTGRDAGALDAPGVAQTLADGVPYSALEPLVVGPRWGGVATPWTGAPCDLFVREDAPWLVEVARVWAAAASTPTHEVTVRPMAAAETALRRASRAFALMLDVACPAGPDEWGDAVGLATAHDRTSAIAWARHPPRTLPAPRVLTRTLRVGVVGEIRLQGGCAPNLVLPTSPWGRGIDWGSAFRTRNPSGA